MGPHGTTVGNVLDDEELIEQLSNSKIQSVRIEERIAAFAPREIERASILHPAPAPRDDVEHDDDEDGDDDDDGKKKKKNVDDDDEPEFGADDNNNDDDDDDDDDDV